MGSQGGTIKASASRIAIYIASFLAIGIVGAGFGSGRTIVVGFIALCGLIVTGCIMAKWPTLTIDDEGVCFSSLWGRREARWREVRSIVVGGWGPFRYVKVSKTKGGTVTLPQWFPNSSDDLRIEMESRWRSRTFG